MANIKLIQIGKNKDKLLKDKIEYYSKIINSDSKFEIIELKDQNKKTSEKEFRDIISKTKSNFIFILSEEGKEYTSKEFSKRIKSISETYKNIIFCIGGPAGFEKPITWGDEIISISKMTFTHEMCQLFLIEQIYRAIEIKKGSKYHRD